MRTVQDVLGESYVNITEDGVRLRQADPAMVGMVDLRLKPELFKHYDLSDEVRAGINVEELYKFLKSVSRNDEVSISYKQYDESNSWSLEAFQDGLNVRTVLNYLNISEDDTPNKTDLEWSNTFQIESSKMKRAIEFLGKRADTLNIDSGEEDIILEANVDSKGRLEAADVTLSEGDGFTYVDFESEAFMKASLDYLKMLFKGRRLANISDQVEISIRDDYPLKIEFEDDYMDYQFILAPRIQE